MYFVSYHLTKLSGKIFLRGNTINIKVKIKNKGYYTFNEINESWPSYENAKENWRNWTLLNHYTLGTT